MRKFNKKAQTSHTMVKSILWFFFLTIILLSVVFLVQSRVSFSVDTKDIEANLFFQEILYTNNGIVYNDHDISRSYPGIIDKNRFNLEVLNKSINYGAKNYYLAVNLSLSYINGTRINSFLYNPEWYKRWKPLSKHSLFGPGSTVASKKNIYVLVRDNNDTILSARLEIEVVYPRK